MLFDDRNRCERYGHTTPCCAIIKWYRHDVLLWVKRFSAEKPVQKQKGDGENGKNQANIHQLPRR